jgi:Putative DNA-binding domain
MNSLRDLQREILSFALGESAAVPSGWVVADGLSAARRLGVYRNNAQIGFAHAMQATFPVLVRLSGEDWFNQTALCYQRAHPSCSGDLSEVGSVFAAFLTATLRGGDYEYFADVARLEWAYSEMLNKRAAGPVNFEGLDGFSDEDYGVLCFLINPTMCLIESPYPLFAIWTANQCGVELPPIVNLNEGGSLILLIRRADRIEVQELAPHVFALLRAFAAGATVRAGVDSVLEIMGEFDLADALGQLIGLGALIGLKSTAEGGPRGI